jgi:L-ascorbate metabolism protein UlaG (beta-lactamase superfamily)
VTDIHLTRLGGPTTLIEIAGWRLLTDPTFDAPGRRYGFGLGTASTKTVGPAIQASELGRLDAILVSHDHHADNLDDAGRELLPSADAVITTPDGQKRLKLDTARGLKDWETTTLSRPGLPDLHITATPGHHGPPVLHRVVGQVIGFAIRVGDDPRVAVWVSGDSVLYSGLKQVAERFDVDVAVIHLGSVQFGVTGPVRFTMTAKDGVELMSLMKPRVIAPVHYEGWSHFVEGEDGIRATFETAPVEISEKLRWLPLGESVSVG